ncbi:MAG: FecR domain-containing protein [Bacteroidota bacterium]
MKLTEEHIDELIAKYLAGEASPEEAILLDDWKKESPEHERYFVACSETLHQTIHLPIDTTALYKRILSRANISQPKVVTLKPFFTSLRIAASLLIVSLLGLTFYVLNKQPLAPEKTVAARNQSISEQLADGSTVTLNKQSKLTLLQGFNSKQRKLRLEGEAYFEVIHDVGKPFTIDAGGIEITDIGTAFNVQANRESDSVIVHVTEGIVNLATPDTNFQLVATQTALFIRSQRTLNILPSFDQNNTAYHSKKFRFKAQKLHNVLQTINQVYDQPITLNNALLSDCLITVDFMNETPETIASIISETLGISYRKTETGFELNGNTCLQ